MICKWPGKVVANTTNGNLVDFTDILPTFAGIANIPVPSYGILDGTSFYPQLKGRTGKLRRYIFTDFTSTVCGNGGNHLRYSQDSVYKLYDNGNFYRFKKDILETNPLTDSTLTPRQQSVKQNLQNILNNMHN